jgi:hypothetical protein
MAFNRDEGYHGSEAVEGGKLKGSTGKSDYFFFYCPKCNDGQILRVLEYAARKSAPMIERNEKKQPKEPINLAFHLYCPVCQLEDFVKIDNNHQSERFETR